ncbi:MAG: hypothetical protein H0T79_11430, partial [Deltaproteobacteria bacterium]|nr:hypothetical protein [Deltaproteobacteria bacterium]
GWVEADGANPGKPGKVTAPCILAPDADAAITRAAVDGMTRVRYCVGESPQCFSFDVVSGQLDRLPVPPPLPVSAGAHVETQNPELKLCNADVCTTMTPKILPQTARLAAATNAAGTYFVVLLGNAAAGQGYAEIWDVAKSKKTAVFRYAREDFKCGEVTMLDNTIYVSASACTSPAARGALYTLKGQKIANVGNKDFGVFGNKYVQVDGPRWAFLEENANRIAIQDIVKGKVTKTIDISPLWGDSPEAMGNPGESALVRLVDGRLAIIAGSPANGSVAVVDVATGEVKVTRAPLCR